MQNITHTIKLKCDGVPRCWKMRLLMSWLWNTKVFLAVVFSAKKKWINDCYVSLQWRWSTATEIYKMALCVNSMSLDVISLVCPKMCCRVHTFLMIIDLICWTSCTFYSWSLRQNVMNHHLWNVHLPNCPSHDYLGPSAVVLGLWNDLLFRTVCFQELLHPFMKCCVCKRLLP
jgi:hypothetical protein